MSGPLDGVRVLSVAINLPGPATARRLVGLGATATAVLPPDGDPLEEHAKPYFDELHAGQRIERLDLKESDGRGRLDSLLAETDLLVTSSRPSALARLELDHDTLHPRHPQLCQIDLVGHHGDQAERAGHDLTFQAAAGLLRGTALPTSTVVDLAAAERAAGEATALLVQRARTGVGERREVVLADVAADLARPLVHRLTTPDGLLGGGLPLYRTYETADGRVAVAALEPHFVDRLLTGLGIAPPDLSRERVTEAFATRTAAEWQKWAEEQDVPLVAVTSAF